MANRTWYCVELQLFFQARGGLAVKTIMPDFILTDPAIKSTGLEAAEISRQLPGYSEEQEHPRRDGESQEEMLNKTQSMTTLATLSEPFMDPSLIAGKCSCLDARCRSSLPQK